MKQMVKKKLKKNFNLTTNSMWMEEPLHHFDLKHLQLWLAY